MALQKRGPSARKVRGATIFCTKKRLLKPFLVYENKVISKKKVFNLGGDTIG